MDFYTRIGDPKRLLPIFGVSFGMRLLLPPEHRHFFMTDVVGCNCPKQCHKTVAEFKWTPETSPRLDHVANHPCEELAAIQDFSTKEAHEAMKVATVRWATQEACRSKGFFGEPGSGRIQRRVQHNGQVIIAASDGPIGYSSNEGGFHTKVFPHLITAVYPV